MTLLYEFWYDLVCLGRYTHEIKRMHDVYGKLPTTEIGPLTKRTMPVGVRSASPKFRRQD